MHLAGESPMRRNRFTIAELIGVVIFLAIFCFWWIRQEARAQSYQSTSPPMVFTSTAIGGGLLAIGATVSTTVNVTGAQVGMPCVAAATDGTDMVAVGLVPTCTVTSAVVVTVRGIAIISLTPASKTYSGRVFPN